MRVSWRLPRQCAHWLAMTRFTGGAEESRGGGKPPLYRVDDQKSTAGLAVLFWCDRVCKPGSVLTAIYLDPGLLPGSSHLLGTAGQACCPTHGVAPDRVYIVKPMSPWAGCALTAPFHPCSGGAEPSGRYISVALVLGSPPAGVTRYPCPVEPGLSSHGAFQHPRAAVRPGRKKYCTLTAADCQMSCKFFFDRLYYTHDYPFLEERAFL